MRRMLFALTIVLCSSTGAVAKPVYLSCPSNDPDWPSPLQIMVDEDRTTVMISNRANSGESPNPVFSEDSVVFGFAGSRFFLSRVNLSLITTSDYVHKYRSICKLGKATNRAF
jgi:hypothetical protein